MTYNFKPRVGLEFDRENRIKPDNCNDLLSGNCISKSEVAAAIQTEPSIFDCVVLARTRETGDRELVAYVVSNGPFVQERINAHLLRLLPAFPNRITYIPIKSVPLTPTGEVDELALTQIEVIDSELVRHTEEKLRSLPKLERVAVEVQEKPDNILPFHLSDLLPDWQADLSYEFEASIVTSTKQAVSSEDLEPRVMAIADGGVLTIAEDAPKTLTDALIQTAIKQNNKGIIYIQPDGKELFQTYSALLEEAKRILAGLYENGLKPRERVILQIDALPDYFATFWACVLGGIVPVTVAVAPSYQEKNGVVNKLYNIWQLLDSPPILTSDRLVKPISEIANLFALTDLKIWSVDEFKKHSSTERIYQSQPNDLVFLQLTSGSTGIPKCIQETHRSVICHIQASKQFNGYTTDDISLNWLPFDHVVPLLTYHLKDVYLGCQQIQVKPDVILANPLNWLDLIEAHRVTHTWSPNFGFKLVERSLSQKPNKKWDLSSIKFFMNAGEQVTLPVVRDFLYGVAPFGVSQQAMQPAFGMAEACTCITYQNNFNFETGIHRVWKSSLSGSLKKADRDDAMTSNFVDLGSPIPGVQIRIVDRDNHLLPEGVIGRLQIKGDVVTPGYFNNEAANLEAFVGDGWFNSGDLGFILNGRLTLTGREKETIVIRGANFYCYEIEDTVNKIDGVEPTFVGVCAVSIASTGTEEIAIFFVTKQADFEQIKLIQNIKIEITKGLGITPAYIIPLTKQGFPKTTSGKIQRAQLKKSLLAGEFQTILKEIDIQTCNTNTLPDWFYSQVWRPKFPAFPQNKSITGTTLVFIDRLGLGNILIEKLCDLNCQCVCVEIGSNFAKISHDRYQINPKHAEDYRQLVASLWEDNISISRILHLWTYQEYKEKISSVEALEQSLDLGVYSLLFLTQALAEHIIDERSIQLQVISSYSQPTSPADRIAYEKAPLLGIIKTIPQEIPWLDCRHIDVPVSQIADNAFYILQEIQTINGEIEVAYRNGQRLITRLEKLDIKQEKTLSIPFKEGGMYLLTGGLGGIGIEIANYLLKHYRAKLLLIGRTPLPPINTWDEYLKRGGTFTKQIEAFRELLQLGGEIIYEAVDICEAKELQQVVERAKFNWQCELDGVIHLAGVYQESLLVDETRNNFAATLRPKVLGTWVLHQLIKDNPKSIFINFSSLIGIFGGAMVSAYAAANRFLDSFTHYQRYQCLIRSYCFNWSTWNEVGMSQGYRGADVLRARGYQSLSVKQGLNSLLAGLYRDRSHLLVGLDGNKSFIRQHIESNSCRLQKLCVYFTSTVESFPLTELQALSVRDRFGTPVESNFVQLEQMPLLPDGTIDRRTLLANNRFSRQQVAIIPQTEVEKIIASIWQEVLGIDAVDTHSNFFELGGNSLLLAQVTSKLQLAFNVNISLSVLFQYPTISLLSKFIVEKPEREIIKVDFTPSIVRGKTRRDKVLRLSCNLSERHHFFA